MLLDPNMSYDCLQSSCSKAVGTVNYLLYEKYRIAVSTIWNWIRFFG